MTLSELSNDQKIGLAGLLKAVVMANASVSQGEAQGIATITEALGDEEFRKLLDEAEQRFQSVDDLKTLLETITDQPARNLIFGTVWEESLADGDLQSSESDLLKWLTETWNISDNTATD